MPVAPQFVSQFPREFPRLGPACCEDMLYVLLLIAYWACTSLFVVLYVFPVLTYLVGILGAFP